MRLSYKGTCFDEDEYKRQKQKKTNIYQRTKNLFFNCFDQEKTKDNTENRMYPSKTYYSKL